MSSYPIREPPTIEKPRPLEPVRFASSRQGDGAFGHGSANPARTQIERTMKLAILSRNANLYSTRRLVEACRRRGHQVDVLDTLHFSVLMERGQPFLFYNDQPVQDYDGVIPRIGASVTFHGTLVVRHFERMGVFSLNSARGIQLSRDKLRSIQLLASYGIDVPPTAFACGKTGVLRAIEQVGGAPVVIKLLEGTQGIGVILAESAKTAETIVETLRSKKQNVLIQRFVRESKGRDIRALVVGDRVVAAIRRVAQGDEFRANVHRGGRAEPVALAPSYEEIALRAARVMGLHVAGVDLLETDDGPQVLEVNSSPGLWGVESATGVDAAEAIVEHLEARAPLPELDLRQRLSFARRWGVAELVIAPGSALEGQTLDQAGLCEPDLQVLMLSRAQQVLHNPEPDEHLRAGDVLLCFGRQSTLRDLHIALETRAPAYDTVRQAAGG